MGVLPEPDKTDTILTKNKPTAPSPAASPGLEVVPVHAAVVGPLDLQKLIAAPEAPCGPLQVMPDLKGMNIRRAVKILNGARLKCRVQGSGLAVSQDPLPGTPLKPDTDCIIKFEPHS